MRVLSLASLAALVAIGLSTSTQYVAAELHHDPRLGAPWRARREHRRARREHRRKRATMTL